MAKKKPRFYAGIDLGGTSLLSVVTDEKGKVLGTHQEKTCARGDAPKVMDQLASSIARAAKEAGVKTAHLRGAGVGAAGAVDPRRGVVHVAPNLKWENVPLARELEKRTRVRTFVDNDVHVALIGEYMLGAAKGAQNAVAIWVGTGIGGALIVRRRLHYGGRGSAGEIGHMVIALDGPTCGCGRRGCVEAIASRSAMERDILDAGKAGRRSAALDIMEENGKSQITSSVIEKALARKDPVVTEVVSRAQAALGALTANLVNVLDPNVVVLGGGLVDRLGERFLEPVRQVARSNFLQKNGKVSIVPSKLGGRAGAVGAALLARAQSDKE